MEGLGRQGDGETRSIARLCSALPVPLSPCLLVSPSLPSTQGKVQKMSTYSFVELLQQWKLGDLTAEQAMGFLLQNMVVWEQRQLTLEKRLPPIESPRNAQ